MSLEVIGAFESTYLPRHDVDVMELTGHSWRWQSDLTLLAESGVRRLRYPIRWHRVESEQGRYDWTDTDAVLGRLRDLGLSPVIDLVHHTSYPAWLDGGFADPRFAASYLRYCEAVAQRYPWLQDYTLFNEPFATLFLAGHERVWPPYGGDMLSLVRLFRSVLPAISEAGRMWQDLLPHARHVYVDTCEGHTSEPSLTGFATMANDRRFAVLDLLLGHDLDPARPFFRHLLEAGGEDLLGMAPMPLDVLGLDYYAHSEWHFSREGGITPNPQPQGLAALIGQYAARYPFPLWLSETNIRGTSSDRASWLKHTLEECERAMAAGAPLEAYCWFPFIDSCDWDSLLSCDDGHIDPVGVYWLDESGERRPSSMSAAYAAVVRGMPSKDLPAYHFREPVRSHVRGLLPRMAHWDWQDPPSDEDARTDLRTITDQRWGALTAGVPA